MQYRRSAVLIDKRFQLRFSFFVCSWIFALSFVYPVIIYTLFNYCMHLMATDPQGPAFASIEGSRREVITLLVGFQAIFIVITFLISVFVSHRIAGPLYKLKQKFREAKRGDLRPDLAFRRKDNFQGIAEEYNEMIRGIDAHFGGAPQRASQAIHAIEKALSQG